MVDVRISDSLYEQASLAAQAHRVSVDQFIAEAVQLRLEDNEDAFFTPARIAAIREAQVEARTGNNIDLNQYKDDGERRRAEWQAKRPA